LPNGKYLQLLTVALGNLEAAQRSRMYWEI
jgi:hypothetical protein